MPFDDWQFYVVTAAALCAAWAMVRAILPRRRSRSRRVGLTIGRTDREP